MSIVTIDEMQSSLNLKRFGLLGYGVSNLIMKGTGLSDLNRKYDQCKHLECSNFLDEVIEKLQLSYQVPTTDLARIPKSGPFVTISNHPLGGADGIVLMKLISTIRPDFKVMGNYLLHKIEPLQPMIFAVDPFESNQSNKQNVSGLREIIRFVSEGKPFGLFPAGEVSTYRKDKKEILDREWNVSAIKLLKRLKIPIIPIYFHAKNSDLFYQLAKLSPKLRTARLPSELLHQANKLIQIRIGQAISVDKQDQIIDLEEFGSYLRGKTYLLGNGFRQKSKKIKESKQELASIISSRPVISLKYELSQLKDKRLFTHKSLECYFTPLTNYSNLLREIGRLREITFRNVGEGSNKSVDLDMFDDYYYHLFLWDKDAEMIVGAYRIGLGNEIYEKKGKKGFYLNQLFKFDKVAMKLLPKSIEMGRAFIVDSYQRQPMPLFLLWKGIALVTLHHPEYEYIIGSVSISNKFTDFSKSLMISFMESYFFDKTLANSIKPRKKYKVKFPKVEKEFALEQAKSDLNKLDQLIDEIEPNGLRLPVLFKKYIKQNARIVAFNVDPTFNYTLDGFMYIKIKDIPNATMKPALLELERQLLAE